MGRKKKARSKGGSSGRVGRAAGDAWGGCALAVWLYGVERGGGAAAGREGEAVYGRALHRPGESRSDRDAGRDRPEICCDGGVSVDGWRGREAMRVRCRADVRGSARVA